jgi:ribose-phosphate pyrophosphokinase
MIILAMPGSERLGRIARDLHGAAGAIEVHRFPDGESLVRLTAAVSGEDAVLVAGLERPDAKVLPLIFAAATARDLGAASVGLVAPYLPYLRQDRHFHAGEAVSARYFARLLSQTVDWLITVDPHLHRVGTLDELFSIPTEAVHTAPLMAEWIRRHVEAPLILGPDSESMQWVASIAGLVGAPHAVFTKHRAGDRRVEIMLPDLTAHAGRRPVLVDDIISSGGTMAAATRALRGAGWAAPVCLAVHAIFGEGIHDTLRDAGAAAVVTCNTIPHPTNAIDVEGLLAEAVSHRLCQCHANATIAR